MKNGDAFERNTFEEKSGKNHGIQNLKKYPQKTAKECNVGKRPTLLVSLSGSNRSALMADLLAVHNIRSLTLSHVATHQSLQLKRHRRIVTLKKQT
jgi:hypothetical protein